MTLKGAITELQLLLKANDMPTYYKPCIEKVIETIQMEWAYQMSRLDEMEHRIEMHERAMAKAMRDTADTPQTDLSTEEFVEGMKNLKMEVKQTDCDKCIWSVCNYNKVDWDADTPQTEEKHAICNGCVYCDLPNAFHPCASCVDFSKYVGKESGDTPQTDCDNKDEPQTNGYQTFNGTSVYVSRLTDEPQTERSE